MLHFHSFSFCLLSFSLCGLCWYNYNSSFICKTFAKETPKMWCLTFLGRSIWRNTWEDTQRKEERPCPATTPKPPEHQQRHMKGHAKTPSAANPRSCPTFFQGKKPCRYKKENRTPGRNSNSLALHAMVHNSHSFLLTVTQTTTSPRNFRITGKKCIELAENTKNPWCCERNRTLRTSESLNFAF